MYGYAANGPAPPAYLLLAGPAYMSPSRTPTQGDKLDQITSMLGEVKGRVASMGDQLSELREGVTEVRERQARNENATASANRSMLNGYREHGRQLDNMGEKFESVQTHLNELDAVVKGLTSVTKEATLEAAPDVANVVADRVNEKATPDRKKTRHTVVVSSVSVAVTACIWPFINNVTSHPVFWKQLAGSVGAALSGFAKVMPTG